MADLLDNTGRPLRKGTAVTITKGGKIACPSCGAITKAKYNYCPDCGRALPASDSNGDGDKWAGAQTREGLLYKAAAAIDSGDRELAEGYRELAGAAKPGRRIKRPTPVMAKTAGATRTRTAPRKKTAAKLAKLAAVRAQERDLRAKMDRAPDGEQQRWYQQRLNKVAGKADALSAEILGKVAR